MKGKIYGLIFCLLIVMTACSQETTNSDGSENKVNDTVTEATTQVQYEMPSDLIRSESTVIDDSKTKRIITSQDSYQIGTYIKISIYADKEVPTSIFDELFYTIDRYEKSISTSIASSEISKVNKAAGKSPVVVSDALWELIQKGIVYGDVSEGKFDITIEPLVELWGIGSDHASIPSEEEIQQAISLIDYKRLVLNETEHSVFLPEEGMGIDLGAIAKGFIADELKQIIIARGYEHAIINLGGNVLTVGHKPNSDTWSVGVRDPQGGQTDILGILYLKDNSIVSSGVYERFFEEGGVRYHHILNPFTGYPEQNHMQAISIISEKSVDGDGLSTSLFAMGLKEAYAYASTRNDIEVLFITDDNKVYYTDGLKEIFTLTNTLYEEVGKYEE